MADTGTDAIRIKQAPNVDQAAEADESVVDATARTGALPRRRRWPEPSPATIAVVIWAIGTPVALAVPRLGGAFGGGGQRTWSVPVAAILILAVLLAVLTRGRERLSGWLAGTGAGLFSAWAVLCLSSLTRGTPFPFYGLLGDSGRLTALATRYSVTAASSDGWIPGVPGDYPPLFPWLIGRVSALIDQPAWKLVGRAEILLTGLAVLVGYLLWRRLFPEWVALALTLTLFALAASPPKAYEFFTLMLLLPWLIGTFGRPPRGRLHWLAGGLLGGLIFLTYYGWFIFAAIGALAIMVGRYREEADRRGYLLYLGKVVAVTLAVSSWYLVPFLIASFTGGAQSLGDVNGSAGGFDDLFPFLQFTVTGLLELIGLVGLIVLYRRVWWARYLLAIVAGAYAYRVIFIIGFVLTNHTQLSSYAARLATPTMALAGVLVLVHAVPRMARQLAWRPPFGLVAVGLAVAIAWTGIQFNQAWTPAFGGSYSNYTIRAYNEPYPDGHYVVSKTADSTPWFPVGPIQQAVERVYGPNPDHVSLSVDDRLYAFLPWPGYLSTDRIGLFVQWDRRFAEVQRLARLSDPTAFASATRTTAFGPIDIFILKRDGAALTWSADLGYNGGSGTVTFDRDQFDAGQWQVEDLPEDYVIAIRR